MSPRILTVPLSRRGLLGGGAALLAGCAHKPSPMRLAPGLPGSPVAPVTGPSVGYQGPVPVRAHERLWDVEKAMAGPTGLQSAPLVIVGGGLSGLALAWRLRDLKPVLIEHESRVGGHSQGQDWDGLAFSVGAAYFAQAPAGSLLSREFYRPLGLHRAWRVAGPEDTVMQGGKAVASFWEGTTDPAAAPDFTRVADHFRQVSEEAYPDMPPGEWQVLNSEQLAALDRQSFREALVAATGPLHPHVEALLQYYCYSSLGGTLDEISAAAGYNFYCAEMEGNCTLPGGNSRVAERLLAELLASGVDVRTERTVVRVRLGDNAVAVTVAGGEQPLVINADRVVMACPKFACARVVYDLPVEQAEAMRRIKYRAYLVANVLIDAPGPSETMGMYLLDPPSDGFTDFVVAEWAAGGHPSRSVLTLYRALPTDGGRASVFDDASFEVQRAAFMAQVQPLMSSLGIGGAPIYDLRIQRWGHALPLAARGLVADGTLALARRPVDGRVFFCNQDDWALPALETCLVRALEVEAEVRERIAAR